MSHLTLFLFGPPGIERDGKLIEVNRRKAIALVAYLAVVEPRPGSESCTRDALATLFWPEMDQVRARTALRQVLLTLKKALGERWLEIGKENVALRRDAGFWLDVDHFHHRLAKCRTHNHPPEQVCPACLTPLTEAVGLYRDDFLAGFTLSDSPGFDEWQSFQGEGLRRELSGALGKLVRCHSAQGEYESAVAYARRWLALDRLHEPAHRCLMELYAQAGQQAEALRQYQECAQILKRELDILPQEKTVQLYQAIWKTRSLSLLTGSHHLPPQPTPFVGREDDLTEIDQLLGNPDCRLLTLVGVGGVGKTRLALQAATERVASFCHGVHFVSLASLGSAELLVPTIADALRFSFYSVASPKEQLLSYFREKEMLLVLDGFEHLLSRTQGGEKGVAGGEDDQSPGSTELLLDILECAPGVKLLVTSRERLNLRWEWLFGVKGLRFPKNGKRDGIETYDAVQLFVQIAGRVRPGFSLTGGKKSAVIRICQSLEGLPLGIELAAGWVHSFSCREIAQRIERDLTTLATSMHDVPERHRSLHAVVDRSWGLLPKDERDVFKKLSVFRRGFQGRAAEKVAGGTLVLLSALVSKSLLQSSEGRYRMHEVLRQYAGERLDEDPEESKRVHDLHCEYFADLLHRRERGLWGGSQREVLEEIGAEIENVRAGWQWAVVHGKTDAIDRSLGSLGRFYEIRGWFREGEAVFGRLVEKWRRDSGTLDGSGEQKETLLGMALARQGYHCCRLARFEEGRELARESLSVFRRLGIQREIAYALNNMGLASWSLGEYAEAKRMLEESLTVCVEIGGQPETAQCFGYLGLVAWRLGDPAEARRLRKESLTIWREIGDQREIASCLNNLGIVVRMAGEYAEAKRLLEESLAIFKEVGEQRGIAVCLSNLGVVAKTLGQYAEARRLYEENIAFCKETGDQVGIAKGLDNLGVVAGVLGELGEAKRLHQESLAIRKEVGARWGIANCCNNLGFASSALGERQEAWRYFYQALETAIDIQANPAAMETLVGMATLLIHEGKKEQAVEFASHALHHPATYKDIRDKAKGLLSEMEILLSPDVFAAARERGEARETDDFVRIVMAE